MEFKKLETEAALELMNELRKEAEDLKTFSNQIEVELAKGNIKPDNVDRQKTISINCAMKSEIFKKAVDQLETDVKEQSFDY